MPHNHICVCELQRYGCKFWLLRLPARGTTALMTKRFNGTLGTKFLFHSSLMQEERMFVTKKINYNNSPDSTPLPKSTKPNGMGWHTVVSPKLFFRIGKLRLDVDSTTLCLLVLEGRFFIILSSSLFSK